MALARSRGILTVVDAVASIGGHTLDVDRLGLDIAVIGPQKALAGPAGLSAISVSKNAWHFIAHEHALQGSMLSLLDQKQQWLDTGRHAIPGTPSSIEFFALQAAIERIEAEGIEQVQKRHALAARATRAGLERLGARFWVDTDQASALVTTILVPADLDVTGFLARTGIAGAELSAGVGPGAERLIRLNHTGQRACEDAVIANLKALGKLFDAQGKHTDIDAALRAASSVYGH
jgi:aspartate aminotransferase-like enzyme